MTKIEGIEEDTAKELIQRAQEFYQKDQEEITKKIRDLILENDSNKSCRIDTWYASNFR